MAPLIRERRRGEAADRRDDRGEPGAHRRRAAGPRGARLAPSGRAADLRRARRAVDRLARGAARAAASSRATGSASGRRTARSGCSSSTPPRRSGAILVNVNPAYRTHELDVRAAPVRAAAAGQRRRSRRATTSRWSRRSAPRLPALEVVVFLGRRTGTRCSPPARRPTPRRCATAARASSDDPINIQYTSGTTGFPKGATLATTTSSTTATSSASCAATPRPTASASRCPFYHCFGMVMGNLGALTHGACDGHPGAGVRAGGDAAGGRGGALHVALRRADDVHRRARPPGVRAFDLLDCGPGSWPARRARSRS